MAQALEVREGDRLSLAGVESTHADRQGRSRFRAQHQVLRTGSIGLQNRGQIVVELDRVVIDASNIVKISQVIGADSAPL